MAASLPDVQQRGEGRAVLFTGDTNLSARGAYGALGFAKVGRYRVMLLRRPVVPRMSPQPGPGDMS